MGARTGYYTAVLAKLAGTKDAVVAYAVEHDLAQNAMRNLSDLSNVTVQERSGSEAPLPLTALDCAALKFFSHSAFLNLSQLQVHVIGLFAIAIPSISECHPDAERHKSKRRN